MTDASVVVADPPWKHGDQLPGKGRGATKHYDCMSVAQIMKFPLPPIARDAVLFLWRVSSMQREAMAVIAAWGFHVHSEIVWRKLTKNGKLHFGMGRIVRGAHETCLIATRGRKLPRKAANIRSIFDAPVGAHSEKPAKFYEIVEALFDGPYVELFARRRRAAWMSYGNQLQNAPDAS